MPYWPRNEGHADAPNGTLLARYPPRNQRSAKTFHRWISCSRRALKAEQRRCAWSVHRRC